MIQRPTVSFGCASEPDRPRSARAPRPCAADRCRAARPSCSARARARDPSRARGDTQARLRRTCLPRAAGCRAGVRGSMARRELERALERRPRVVAAPVVQVDEREIHVRAGVRRLLEHELLELELGLEPVLARASRRARGRRPLRRFRAPARARSPRRRLVGARRRRADCTPALGSRGAAGSAAGAGSPAARPPPASRPRRGGLDLGLPRRRRAARGDVNANAPPGRCAPHRGRSRAQRMASTRVSPISAFA